MTNFFAGRAEVFLPGTRKTFGHSRRVEFGAQSKLEIVPV